MNDRGASGQEDESKSPINIGLEMLWYNNTVDKSSSA
jgi:hypothetical protein